MNIGVLCTHYAQSVYTHLECGTNFGWLAHIFFIVVVSFHVSHQYTLLLLSIARLHTTGVSLKLYNHCSFMVIIGSDVSLYLYKFFRNFSELTVAIRICNIN